MKTPITALFGIEFPILAFTHCRDVVAAVSKAGGLGVLGAVGHSDSGLETDLYFQYLLACGAAQEGLRRTGLVPL